MTVTFVDCSNVWYGLLRHIRGPPTCLPLFVAAQNQELFIVVWEIKKNKASVQKQVCNVTSNAETHLCSPSALLSTLELDENTTSSSYS